MGSLLVITSVEHLESELLRKIDSLKTASGVFVSLNKSSKQMQDLFIRSKSANNHLFFIDCVSNEQTGQDTLFLSPRELDLLLYCLSVFIKQIPSRERFIIFDSLATLLIYNEENKVAAFVKSLVSFGVTHGADIIALSQSTTGEDLLSKIYNSFDKVQK